MQTALFAAVLLVVVSTPVAHGATLQLVTENGNVFSIDFDEILNIYNGYNSTATTDQQVRQLINSAITNSTSQQEIDDLKTQINDLIGQLNSNSTSTETEIERLEDLIEDLGANSTSTESSITALQNLIHQLRANSTSAETEIERLGDLIDQLNRTSTSQASLKSQGQAMIDGMGIQSRILKTDFAGDASLIFGKGTTGEHVSLKPYVDVYPDTDFAALVTNANLQEEYVIPKFWSEYSLGTNGMLDDTSVESENILEYADHRRLSGSIAFDYKDTDTLTQTNSPHSTIFNQRMLSDIIAISDSGIAVASSITVDITHPYIGELTVDLIAPDGTVRTLHNRQGGSTDDINTTYHMSLKNTPISGDWTLRITDIFSTNSGTLNSWTFTLYYDPTDTLTQTNSTSFAIPDAQTTSYTTTVFSSGVAVAASVAVDITHPYIGELTVDLIAPDGTLRTLHNRQGGSTDDINTVYYASFENTPIFDDWTLRISDAYSNYSGTLNSWALTLYYDPAPTFTDHDDLIITGNGRAIIPLSDYGGQNIIFRGHAGSGTAKIITSDTQLLTAPLHAYGFLTYSRNVDPGPNSFSVVAGKDSAHTGVFEYVQTYNYKHDHHCHCSIHIHYNEENSVSVRTSLVERDRGDHVRVTGDSTSPVNIRSSYSIIPLDTKDYSFKLYDRLPSYRHLVLEGGFETTHVIPQDSYLYVEPKGGTIIIRAEQRSIAIEDVITDTSNILVSADNRVLTGSVEMSTITATDQFTQTSYPDLPVENLRTVSDIINIPDSGTAATVSVAIDLTHGNIGELGIDLIAPDGTTRTLHGDPRGHGNAINQTYAPLFGAVPVSGNWELQISDDNHYNVGTLNSWTLTVNHGPDSYTDDLKITGNGTVILELSDELGRIVALSGDAGSGAVKIITSNTQLLTATYDPSYSYEETILQDAFNTEYTAQGRSYLYVDPNGGTITVRAEERGIATPFLKIVDMAPDIPYRIIKNGYTIAAGMSDYSGQIRIIEDTSASIVAGGVLYLYPDALKYRGQFDTLMLDSKHQEAFDSNALGNKIYTSHMYVRIPVTGSVDINNITLDGVKRLPYLSGTYGAGEYLDVPVLPGFGTINMVINGVQAALKYADVLGGTGITIADSDTSKITRSNPSAPIYYAEATTGTVAFAIATSDGTLKAIISETISGSVSITNTHKLKALPPPPPPPGPRDPLTADVDIFVNGQFREHITLGVNPYPNFAPVNMQNGVIVTQGVRYGYAPATITGTASIDVQTGDFVEFYVYSKINGWIGRYVPPDGFELIQSSGVSTAIATINSAYIQTDMSGN